MKDIRTFETWWHLWSKNFSYPRSPWSH